MWQTLNVGIRAGEGPTRRGYRRLARRRSTRDADRPDPRGDVTADRKIVDVRQLSEWQTDHVAGAIHVELGDIAAQATRLEEGVQLHCGRGQRAMTAASLLEQASVGTLAVIDGGSQEVTAALAGGSPRG